MLGKDGHKVGERENGGRDRGREGEKGGCEVGR